MINRKDDVPFIGSDEPTIGDSLVITENEDGSLRIQWDSEDPRYEFLNHLTEEQIHDMLKEAMREALYDQRDELQLGMDRDG